MQERIATALGTNGSAETVARINGSIIGQYHKLGLYAIHQLTVAAAGKIGSSYTVIE